MNLHNFEKSNAGKLIKVQQGPQSYLAFVPNPLPPKLDFDVEFVRVASDAAGALGELAGLGRSMSNPQLLVNPFIRREAVLSSRIEGTQAGIAELYAYEAGGQLALPFFEGETDKPASLADVQEVNNYVIALEYGLERLSTLPISKRLMLEMHERLLKGVRGEQARPGQFRKIQNWIGSHRSKIEEAEYVPPPPDEVEKALDRLENFIHQPSDLPPLIRIGLIHYNFEAIHPFIDGNGRTGRLLISLLLIDWKLLPSPLLYLSAYFERHREEYLNLLQGVSEKGQWREWLIFFLQGIIEESQNAAHKARQLQDLQLQWRKQLQDQRASSLVLSIVDMLFVSPVTSATRVQESLKMSYGSANKAIQYLVNMGLLKEVEQNKKRNKFYYSEAILAAII